MSSTTRIRALAAFIAVTTGALFFAGGPAQAASPTRADVGDDVCWANADDGRFQCFSDEAAFAEAVAEQTGTILVDPSSRLAARPAAGVLATYTLARFYEDASYVGSSYAVTSTNSALCATGGVSGNFSVLWNDRVSSFRSYHSCSTRIFEDAGQAGAWFGYSVNAPGVGGLDDEASSFRVQ